ncbi:hypothetical protein [Micromonospora craniellae]|uniref:hypothetical protein n=1 Tax=Micromonospora craniellae TaxID=2294034 RepID=UPI0011C12A43|nr:hypothetical protein [Micromonospora craniellae]QOC91133.1 hypothetical protein ID554_24300 [Micromonospora craniellae]
MSRGGGELDGFRVGFVPDGMGGEVSDFASEWEDVAFASRFWERQTPDGHQVDLRVHVLRGERLVDREALREFLAAYQERDPTQWQLAEFPHDDGPGLAGEAEAFWLVEPGVAGWVLTSPEFGATTVPIAQAVRPVTEVR